MDTFCEVISLKPREVFPSARVPPESVKMMIFTHVISWDLGYTQAETVGVATSDAHVLTTGRPLWSAQLATVLNDDYVDAFNTVRMKLLCGTWVEETDRAKHANQCAAVLCARVGLDPNPYAKLSKELVASHAALLEFFDFNEGRAVISYPSDAALARAARSVWRKENRLVNAINRVSDFMHTREIQHGERGEVAAQILILNVLDKVSQ